ncbi:porin [Tautonia plasticadhaerens]|uniref:Phosphate-selective porin O and P n=1 Tax=Tautonia plasticadhaerens TaxID=2527974 RepID=A0A518GVH2_9BACT|nr:porin [Tautonia plasticadhaerens]QDV32600.1 Phosphate-selective porin O and P [Tautonia plasticadhaerens]
MPAAWVAIALACPAARAQGPPDPIPPPVPAHPAPTGAGPQVSVDQLAERLLAMERQNRALAEELQRTRAEHEEQMRLILDRLDEVSGRFVTAEDPAPPPDGASPPGAMPFDPRQVENPVPDYTEGQFAPDTPAPGYPLPSIVEPGRSLLNGSFGPGFRFRTHDGEFRLKVNYESQVEGRVWDPSDQQPANSGIYLPRQRIFFSGNITKPIEYEFAINRGFGGLNLLNAYLNFHVDDRFELRMGRFFTPLFYDQYAISNYWLMQPERSVFTTNLSLNRQFGAMAWGYLFDKRLDYAAGAFNGSRNSFEPLTNGLDFVGYLNARPFQMSEALPAARFLNLGASVGFGHQDQSPVPRSFRIAGGSPSADVPGPATVPFLILDPGVAERGDRLIGSVHAAYFHKGLSLIGEWQYGYGGYAAPGAGSSTRVPFSGFYASGGYFLTGEEVERRSRLYPLRPLIPTREGDRRGIGAWELTGRVSTLELGRQVFEAGLANPELWSNRAVTTELGANWYWNEYMKVYIFWLHGAFADPVLYAPGRLQETADMFWLRFQLYF